jgi:hypothetical protein
LLLRVHPGVLLINLTLAGDEKGCGEAPDAAKALLNVIVPDQYWVGYLELLSIWSDVASPPGADCHTQNDKAFALVSRKEFIPAWNFRDARAAPSGPEVYQSNVSFEGFRAKASAIDGFQIERWGGPQSLCRNNRLDCAPGGKDEPRSQQTNSKSTGPERCNRGNQRSQPSLLDNSQDINLLLSTAMPEAKAKAIEAHVP